MFKLLLFIIIHFSSLFINATEVKVITVIDGDTIDVRFKDGSKDRVRLVGVDCPESLKKNSPNEYPGITDIDYLYNWALKIKEYTYKRLLYKKIDLAYEK